MIPRTGSPPQLAAKFTAGDRLMSHKAFVEQEAGYFNSGIEAPGTTELDRRGFPYLFGEGSQRSIVGARPDFGGKESLWTAGTNSVSDASKATAQYVIWPLAHLGATKALVDQVSRELKQLLAEYRRPLSLLTVVLRGQDYPQNDEAIRTGRFDIAVIISLKSWPPSSAAG